MIKTDNPIELLVFSHRRSGTHLTLDSIVQNFSCYRAGFANFDTDRFVESKSIYKSHMTALEARNFLSPEHKVIYVFRDCRDVMVSLYYYEQSFDSEVEKMPFKEFVFSANRYQTDDYEGTLNRIEYWKFHAESWLGNPQGRILFVGFDDFKNRFEATVSRISSFLELPANDLLKQTVRTRPENFVSQTCQEAWIWQVYGD